MLEKNWKLKWGCVKIKIYPSLIIFILWILCSSTFRAKISQVSDRKYNYTTTTEMVGWSNHIILIIYLIEKQEKLVENNYNRLAWMYFKF